MSSNKRRRQSAQSSARARRSAEVLGGQTRQPTTAAKPGTAVAARPTTAKPGAAGGASGATVRRTSVQQPNYRSRMNRHLRARRRRAQILGAVVAVLVVGGIAWLLLTRLPHGTTAKTNSPAASTASAHATLTAQAGNSAACSSVTVPGLNGTATKSGGPPVITGTLQTGSQCLQWVDVKLGTGAAIKAGDTVTVNYTGWLLNGQRFDSSLDAGRTPFQVQNVGNAQVISGWNLGLIGMKLGGERELIIPSALGYGTTGSLPLIPANATLIFNITVVSIP